MHLVIVHVGGTRKLKEFNRQHNNITVKAIMTGIMSSSSKDTENFSLKIDLIDLEITPDTDYKFILVHQDNFSKIFDPHYTQTKREEEVIYCIFSLLLESRTSLIPTMVENFLTRLLKLKLQEAKCQKTETELK